ncbi:putative polyketide synthase [Whalleya microplaca]|nr:putative polyketide synthase [Whalleya microplaca]
MMTRPLSSREEPIAVCGLSLKFPQDASSEKEFWAMLLEKRTAMTEFPADRLNIDAFHHTSQRNALRTRCAHFIKEDLGLFDANFFSLTPTEASAMDPMQRILLETAYRAFENAGMRLEDIKGSRTSVHTGCFTNDYLQQILKDSQRLPPYAAVGATQSMLANRLSWFFDLRGPSVNLDSACSSSAMAVDLACQLLHRGVTDMGVVAGCNILLDPDYSTILSNMQMLSPDGRCFAFDHRANGYSRGEGVGVAVLKRLSDALRNNDPIRAIIRASGTNQDGRTPGITQPDPKAQAQLIRETYQRACLSMEHTRFFEAHGTGTAIGDPAEVGAIAECFNEHRNSSDPLYVGSVKTNIGHLEGASGIAGLIKAILVVESGIIPPNANFESINRRLASYDYMISLPSECTTWPPCEVRRASINSFGYGGTNSHIVIDDVSSYLRRKGLVVNFNIADPYPRAEIPVVEFPKLFVWSATTGTATRATVTRWEEFCSKRLDMTLSLSVHDIAYTLDSRRSALLSKSFAVVSSLGDLRSLAKLASVPVDTPKQPPRLAFVFTGQGAQWYAMGRELLMYPEFAGSIQTAELALKKLGCCWSLQEELLKDKEESMIDRPDLAQSLTAVVQMGLVDLLKSFGISPVAVVGHSMGEIAAAYCAEYLTRESALRVAYYRGLFVATIPEKSPFRGAMLAVAVPPEKVSAYFDRLATDSMTISDDLVVSCINSPCNTTISGEESKIERLREILEREGIFARRLRVPVAYHCHQMGLIVADCLRHLGTLESPKPIADIKMVSSVTGTILTKERACEASYWTANLVSPVLFSQAVKRLCRDSHQSLRKKIDGSHREAIVVDNLVEIGPHAALRLPIQETINDIPRKKEIKYMSSLYRGKSASLTLLQLLGELHCGGMSIDLRRVNDPEPSLQGARISLIDAPQYPFDHSTRYWSESPLVQNYRLRAHGNVELLGSPSIDLNPLEPRWRCHVQVADMTWLLDHKLNGRAIYPASAMVVMAIQGASQLNNQHQKVIGFTLRNVRYESALAVPSDSTDLETRLQLRPLKTPITVNSHWAFSVHSATSSHWTENCSGTIEVHYDSESCVKENRQKSRYYKRCFESRDQYCNEVFDSPAIYDNLAKHGFHYGPSFQGIMSVHHDGAATATSVLSLNSPLSDSSAGNSFIIHPGTLDSFLHFALVSLSGGNKIIPTQAISRIDKLWISAEGLRPSYMSVQASAKFEGETSRTKLYSGFALANNREHVRLVLEGLQTTIIASVESNEEAVEYRKFWCGIKTGVDVETLPGREILRRLDSIHGSNPLGPRDFFYNLRHYIYSVMKELCNDIKETGIDSTKPYLKRYVDWMGWQLDTVHNCAANKNSLRHSVAKEGFLGEFFLRVADSALDILQGKSDMVKLIFEDDLVEKFYRRLLESSTCFHKLQFYLKDLTFKYPNMDFLEIGAGTGSFTEHVLKGISSNVITGAKGSFNSYCYTDISPVFFERARVRFPGLGHKLKFATLNVEQDPLTQGFKEETFDIISASNVLHVTKDLDRTLKGLRRLMRTEGKLLLHEYIHPERIEVGFVFGLLPGWWPDTDDGRVMSPLLSEEAWNSLLRRNGFSGADFILRDFADEESHLMSIICATAVEFGDVKTTVLPEVTIALEPDSSMQAEMADILFSGLSAEGYGVMRIDLTSFQGCISSSEIVITLFDLESAILSRLDERSFSSLKHLLSCASKVLWISKGSGPFVDPSHGMIHGFARVFRIENIKSTLSTLALEKNSDSRANDYKLIGSALKSLLKNESFEQPEDYTVQDGALNLSRIYENVLFKEAMSERLSGETLATKSTKDAKPFRVILHDVGSYRPPRIIEDSHGRNSVGPDEVEIEIKAVALNPADISVITGKASNLTIGRECAGFVTKVGSSCDFTVGDRVCAYGTDILHSTSRTNRSFVIKIPESLSFEEASTLPQDYIIANYLAQEVRIQHDDVVVVRGGDTRLGRAMLDVLKKYTPMLCTTAPATGGERSYFNGVKRLEEACFAESVRSCFNSGANLVLDFANTDITQLIEGVSKFGQILSIRTSFEGNDVPINCVELPATVGFKTVDIIEVLQHRFDRLGMPFSKLSDTFTSLPLQIKTIDLSNIETVAASARGLAPEERIVIRFDDRSQIRTYKLSETRELFDPSSSYVISGGLGDLGQCIARWMASRGARNLILFSRSGPRSEAAMTTVRDLQEFGVKVRTPLCNVADHSSLQAALQQIQDMPAIKGCVQAAGALKDIMYENMSFEDWQVAVNPKVYGSWNLHELLPKGMDFFILTSSITGIMGQATQINYAAGNTYQDALARYRLSIGEKAVSLDLGLLATGGLLAQTEGLAERLAAENVYTMLSESEVLDLFDYFCDSHLDIGDISSQIISGIINPSLKDRRGANFPPAFSHPFWSQMLGQRDSNEEPEGDTGGVTNFNHSLAEAGSVAEMCEIVAGAIADQICSLVLTTRASISLEEPLHMAGADSLSAVYLRNWIMKQFAVDVAIFDILGDMSIVALGNFITSEWRAARVST